MSTHVAHAFFLYSSEGAGYVDAVRAFPSETDIEYLEVAEFLERPDEELPASGHVVVSAPAADIRRVLERCVTRGMSIGVLPLPSQKLLTQAMHLPKGLPEQIDIALGADPVTTDIMRCNGHAVLARCSIGRVPILDGREGQSRWQGFRHALRRLRGIRLLGFTITTESGQVIETAASGSIVSYPIGLGMASRFIDRYGNPASGLVSAIVTAPLSITEYLGVIWRLLLAKNWSRRLPEATGLVQSPSLLIEPETTLNVIIDGEQVSTTPAQFTVEPDALAFNSGLSPETLRSRTSSTRELLKTDNLPLDNEVARAKKNRLPVFPYASEARFKDLFTELRQDAETNSAYVVLMILSTLLATTGLYLDSTSVVIGAMLLAPLMTPIVSMSMGILRLDEKLYRKSAKKIAVGIALALFCAMLFTALIPNKIVTGEMQARLNPTLLDLLVAIFAGIAGAYTKSFREIMQGLAGVAIAVALVPPLAVAGIGLGRGDLVFFLHAFLLFSTNLIGIVLFALLTFRVLGFSAAIKGKQSFAFVLLIMMIISVPLYFSYRDISSDLLFERAWQRERFLINDKYVIVKSVERHREQNRDVVTMEILARETLTAEDMRKFKEKIRDNFSDRFVVRANLIYIL